VSIQTIAFALSSASYIIATERPWNYPIFLSLQPIIGAVAAGCPAALKPSEISPAVSSVLADLFSKYLDPSAYRVLNGGVPETTHLLKLKWDHSACEVQLVVLDVVLLC
jgi:aldehyde dehydrogenase (NAD+)